MGAAGRTWTQWGAFGAAAAVPVLAATAAALLRAPDPLYNDRMAFLGRLGSPPSLAVQLPESTVGTPLEAPPPGARGSMGAALRAPSSDVVPWYTPSVIVSKTSLRVDLAALQVDVPSDAASFGFEARQKPGSRNDLYVVPLGHALEWVAEQWKPIRLQIDEPRRGLLVIADREVPYRVLTEVLYTAGQAEFGPVHLAARKGQDLVAFTLIPPVHVGSVVGVLVVDEGFAVQAEGTVLGPGCGDAPGESIAVPKRGTGYDYAGLVACLKAMRDRLPAFEEARCLDLSAASNISYEVFLTTTVTLADFEVRDGPALDLNAWRERVAKERAAVEAARARVVPTSSGLEGLGTPAR
jgi:hypothetical protein